MKLSLAFSLLGAFSSLASGYEVDICSPDCNSKACCTTITGANGEGWKPLPDGYKKGLRYYRIKGANCQFERDHDALQYPPDKDHGSPTAPAGPGSIIEEGNEVFCVDVPQGNGDAIPASPVTKKPPPRA
ncbi:hypothetical protein PG984_013920 [Apiospora sp. TS-2023a]